LDLGRRRKRFLPAILLMEANEVVSIDRLVELLRATARDNVPTHVSRLRTRDRGSQISVS
jgi:hypothetical protein